MTLIKFSTQNNPTTNFPAELCRLITRDPVLHKSDLRTLCFVSADFRSEAELLLYVRIRLENLGQIVSWAKAVIKRPYLAPRTKSLSVRMPPQMSIDSGHLKVIVKAVDLCVNVVALEVLNDTRSLSGRAVNAWIFENHPYKLLDFRNTYFSGACLKTFFAQQPTIHSLSLYPAQEEQLKYHDSLLPNLISLDTSSVGLNSLSRINPPQRTLTQLRIGIFDATEAEELALIETFRSFDGTGIRGLTIARNNGIRGMDLALMILHVIRVLPRLRLFQLLDNTMHVGLQKVRAI